MKHYYCIFIFEITLDILNEEIITVLKRIDKRDQLFSQFSFLYLICLTGFSIFYRATKRFFYLNSQRCKSVRYFFKDLNVLRKRERKKPTKLVLKVPLKFLHIYIADLFAQKNTSSFCEPLSLHNAIVYINSPLNHFLYNH